MMTAAVTTFDPTVAVSTVEEETRHYTFDEEFQLKVVALMWKDDTFVQRTDGLIKPEYFENTTHGVLVDIALRYAKQYRKSPHHGVWKNVMKQAIEDKIHSVENIRLAASLLPAIRDSVDISDRDYVIDEVSKFARHAAMYRAILDAVAKLDSGDFENISLNVRKACEVGAHAHAAGYDYTGALEDRLQARKDRLSGKCPPPGVTTGYAELDKCLYQHGWGKRELAVLMGAAKSGKTTSLINFAVNAAKSIFRYNILYVTLEVSAQIIADRMDANISGTKMFELDKSIVKVGDSVKDFHANAGKFVIHEFPTGQMTVADLRRLLERYRAVGTNFDMVVLDYADLMCPDRVSDNSIENSKSIYINLRGLAMTENIAILTATQTNREGAKAAVATMTHVADDFNKVRIADVVISINVTPEERAMNQARLFFAACRNQASGFALRVEQNLEAMQFITRIVGME